jgi:hypothetical protein
LPNGEIDFVAEKSGMNVYVQVAYLLADEATVEREFGNLLKIQDNYKKYVITMDAMAASRNYDGITHMSLRAFLLSSEL